ncbi:MAG: hypothetical protein K1X86_15975 [Ignavibacteria bacterium]|nr:hypothetical protein [Ignavibacteria bacterium]
MSKLFLFLIVLGFAYKGYSQSKIERDKQSSLYRVNKVRLQTIDYNNGRKNITKYNMDGKPTEMHDYYSGIESNITNYKYDKKGRLTEESYYGYESGDGVLRKYYYDKDDNVAKIISEGSDDTEVNLFYDSHGNESGFEEHYQDPGSAPYFASIINTYELDKLIMSEQECNIRTNEVNRTIYTYNRENVILIEQYWKYCQTDKIEFHTKQSFEYFDSGLMKESIQEDISYSELEIKIYSYEFY